MFARAHVGIAIQLVQGYKGELPFVHYLKQYFTSNKKHGSRDRKQIAQLCYCWFRIGHALEWLHSEQRMITALFLSSTQPNPLLEALNPEWNAKTNLLIENKFELVSAGFASSLAEFAADIFPWQLELSKGIDPMLFALSHLEQPDLFLRARPAFLDLVRKKLERAQLPFQQEGNETFRLANGTKVEDLFELNREVVVQDLNSQKAAAMVDSISNELREKESLAIWDACAASGGKSIFIFDRLPGARLTVTDIRPSILQNLFQRFKQAGLYSYEGFVADLSISGIGGDQYRMLDQQDLILADLPCSGSGTWSRSPENLSYFDPAAIETYSSLQKNILRNLLPKLAPDGYLLYITCSVFKKENEENIDWLVHQFPLKVIHLETLKGYTNKADSMFVALLRKEPE